MACIIRISQILKQVAATIVPSLTPVGMMRAMVMKGLCPSYGCGKALRIAGKLVNAFHSLEKCSTSVWGKVSSEKNIKKMN